MTLLVDAYNVLHVVGVLPPDLAGIDLPELADLIAGSRYRKDSTILVCDGVKKPHRTETPGVHVRFAGPGIKADDLIIRMVQRSSAPRRLTIVTSDGEIARAARRRRSTVMSSEEFLDRLARDQAGPTPSTATRQGRSSEHPADRRQVEHWLRVFGIPTEESDPTFESASEPPGPPASPELLPRKKKSNAKPKDRGDRPTDILRARTLSEIDPTQVDRLDMDRLLTPPTRLQDGPDDEGRNSRP